MKRIHEISWLLMIISALICTGWILYHLIMLSIYTSGIISEPSRSVAIFEVCIFSLLFANVLLYIGTIKKESIK